MPTNLYGSAFSEYLSPLAASDQLSFGVFMSHVRLDEVSCKIVHDHELFPPFSEVISNEVVGLFGRNGCGKTTLLSAIAGDSRPSSGTIVVQGKVGYLRQVRMEPGHSVAQALGVQDQLAIIDRLENGKGRDGDLDQADWTLPSRLERVLARFGIDNLPLDRSVESLSGGERCRAKLATLLLGEPDILLLDEPTNDLDAEGRETVAELLRSWDGAALVATHDRALLEQVDRIIELSSTRVLSVGGGWSTFEQQREAERARALTALDRAKQEMKHAQKTRQARVERQAQRAKQGRNAAQRRDDSKLQINAQKSRAESTIARNQNVGEEQVSNAKEALDAAKAEVELVVPIRIELPRTGLQRGRILIDARSIGCMFAGRSLFGPIDLIVTGPERIALGGRNGSGKTSLLRIISGGQSAHSGSVERDNTRIAILDQHLALLEPDENALQAMQRHNSQLDHHQAHAALAEFGFRGVSGQRQVSTFSGGEKVRLALACLFSGFEPPQLLILDEPTNHLDIHAIELLEQALKSYDGAIICVSHDKAFCSALGLTRTINLDDAGGA